MKTWIKVVGGTVSTLVLAGVGLSVWANQAVASKLARTMDSHTIDFPVPFPLTEEELHELREQERRKAGSPELVVDESGQPDPLSGLDLNAIARERAAARGKHVVESLYACTECHGADLGGGAMVDDDALGHLYGPNLTKGRGGKTSEYSAADWDRAVRHAIKRDGGPSWMPAEDLQEMSDRELSDIIVYIETLPAVDREMPESVLGPVGRLLAAFGQLSLSADLIHDHQRAHPQQPPTPEASVEYGRHLAAACVSCHRTDMSGGPIASGPPDWPAAKNLTLHEEGLAAWTYDDFVASLREGRTSDGTALKEPMTSMVRYTANMTDVELQALWAYFRSLPAVATGV